MRSRTPNHLIFLHEWVATRDIDYSPVINNKDNIELYIYGTTDNGGEVYR